MRRQDREGVPRCERQFLQNTRTWNDPRCVEDSKGWVQPFANWQGWDELNHAIYALRCVLIFTKIARQQHGEREPLLTEGLDGYLKVNRRELHRGMDCARIESDLRTFHFALARSRKCDRPALPA